MKKEKAIAEMERLLKGPGDFGKYVKWLDTPEGKEAAENIKEAFKQWQKISRKLSR